MSSSDRLINYSLRPSKSIERKMIFEVVKEVCTPAVADQYKYVGFGASFFTDFKLVHKLLHIDEMDSIEGDITEANQKRCKFNKPYQSIGMHFGLSTDMLIEINWSKKAIVWLDYDKGLKKFMFEDLKILCNQLKENSFLIVTLRRDIIENIPKDSDEQLVFLKKQMESFKEEFGDNIPTDVKTSDLLPVNAPALLRKMFLGRIDYELSNLYSASEPGEKIVFKQLFNFVYSDNAPMVTFGGMMVKERDVAEVDKLKFNKYDFVKKGEDAYGVGFPIITNKEYHELNFNLPSKDQATFLDIGSIQFIPKNHRANYYNIYKFYPSYIEIKDF